ncbi:thioesterase domain-containing protein [Streptomyces sp. NPDC010273]|uniref:thioesterase II family protein n=1 Tax=Streptomyces sp. NPDC010273 TaxID=3364829 RepID=UPI0036E4DB4E
MNPDTAGASTEPCDDGLLREIRTLSGTDDRVFADEEILRMVLPAFRADYRIVENCRYAPGPPLDCPLTVFTGVDGPKVSADEAEAWRGHTTGTFDLVTLTGGHFFLTAHQERLAEVITKGLTPFLARR